MRLIEYIVKTAKNINPQYSPSVIIDAGSRDLGQSIEFTNEFPTAQIYAFEPNPHQYQICVNLAREYKNIKVLPFALSDIDGEATFHVTPSNIGVSSLLEPTDVPWGENSFYTITVKTVRLDKVLTELGVSKVDILWMDVQGGELAALRGYGNFIENTDFVQCEASQFPYYKDHPLRPELEQFFEDNDYTHEFHLPFEGPPHQYMEGELVCINRKILKAKQDENSMRSV
jgi:FkbM family methyltransferase